MGFFKYVVYEEDWIVFEVFEESFLFDSLKLNLVEVFVYVVVGVDKFGLYIKKNGVIFLVVLVV